MSYWENWATDIASIADTHITRIKSLLSNSQSPARLAFDDFLSSLHNTLNPNVTEDEAIEMLAQHLITKPVFDALFEGYQFTKSNPVSLTMQRILDVLEGESLAKETETLSKFYQSVRDRASGIDNAEGKQKIIIELYDKFFKNAFPRLVARLGIVYTPVEVVDFIINSADVALKQEFGVSLSDEGVHILDPFTGTGTFMVRLLQSGLIKPEDLERKYNSELHANEIVLLAYYIAAINIEETYHYLTGNAYKPFNGIVLTDTFQMFENEGTFLDEIFPENNERVNNQKGKDITVIIGNPPYSAGQNSENDGNKNLKYKKLDDRIKNSYAEYSTATLQKSLYDSYIRAFRWASDRIKDKGLVGFVSNGSFIDSNNMDGVRKCLANEFTSIYCFNLRGNARTSGEQRRQEKDNVFGMGTRTTVAIIILIKNPAKPPSNKVFYYDIGDYLNREQKFNIIKLFSNFSAIEWEAISPNDNYDWINQRNEIFESFIVLGDKNDKTNKTFFDIYSNGLLTSRDSWVYNYSEQAIINNMTKTIAFYNSQVESYRLQKNLPTVDQFIDNNPKYISWSRELKYHVGRNIEHSFLSSFIAYSMYRPFCKQWLYFDKNFNDVQGKIPIFFPKPFLENLVICTTGRGSTKDFSALITNFIPDLEMISKSQCFPLYTYEKQDETTDLFTSNNTAQFAKKDNISDDILTNFQKVYHDLKITKEDIFYFVYGVLHSPEYKQRFSSDLKKMIPRIPFTQDFWAFSKTGRELAYWHLNYETIEPYPVTEYKAELYLESKDYRVEKMRFGKNAKEIDQTKIIYNHKISLSNIPLEAYEYIVNGKSAIEWVIDRYQIKIDKDSGIKNDPNDWSEDPRYILDLVKRIVRVSIESVRLINGLPALNEQNIKVD